MTKKYLPGMMSGFIFGILAVFLSTLGLISLTAEILSPFIFPIAFFIRMIPAFSSIPAIFSIAIILNGILFGAIGYLIQKYLPTNKKKFVHYIFASVVLLIIIAIVVEYFTRGLSP